MGSAIADDVICIAVRQRAVTKNIANIRNDNAKLNLKSQHGVIPRSYLDIVFKLFGIFHVREKALLLL